MGILKKIFGGGITSQPSTMSVQKAEEIIQAYGAVLQKRALTPGSVVDTCKLPFQKEEIKAALIIGIKATNDQQMKEMLKNAYIQLADWQEGAGESGQGLDLSNMNLGDDTEKLAKQVLVKGSSHEKWQAVVQAEQDKLKQELVALGLW